MAIECLLNPSDDKTRKERVGRGNRLIPGCARVNDGRTNRHRTIRVVRKVVWTGDTTRARGKSRLIEEVVFSAGQFRRERVKMVLAGPAEGMDPRTPPRSFPFVFLPRSSKRPAPATRRSTPATRTWRLPTLLCPHWRDRQSCRQWPWPIMASLDHALLGSEFRSTEDCASN